MRILSLLVVCSTLFMFLSCEEKSQFKSLLKDDKNIKYSNSDSIELTNLIRKVYEWHETNHFEDFPYEFKSVNDSIFIGIDWDKYKNNIEVFRKTNFFTSEFLNKHKLIATTLDSSIRTADVKWRNSNDGISLWETGADNWCGCQDNPEKYWKKMTIDSLIINKEVANFVWTWDKELTHTYKIEAFKEKGNWKINSLDGFKHFYTFEEYSKMMKNNN